MEHYLNNPVYHALCTGDAKLGWGTGEVKYFEETVSPFAGFADGCKNGFDTLRHLLAAGRNILYATPKEMALPAGWQLSVAVPGLQFVFNKALPLSQYQIEPVGLGPGNIAEMLALTALTRPGPFGKRTIEFGHYFGIFAEGRLAAMAGQRLHVPGFTEISAVCTHPSHLGKGFARALMLHQMALILSQGQTPFLHVRADNARAIALYKQLGFEQRSPMHFYFLKKS